MRRRPLDTHTDAELLDLTATCPEAFGAFYRRHAAAITAYLVTRTGDLETALDLTAEVFEGALIGRRGFEAARGPARAWLYGIARHKIARNFRARSIDRALRLRLGIPALRYTDEALEEAERLLDASRGDFLRDLALLPAAEREAVLAHVVGERSYREIALGTGVGEAAIRKRVSRGLARLRARVRARARGDEGMRG